MVHRALNGVLILFIWILTIVVAENNASHAFDHPASKTTGLITMPSMYVSSDDVRDATYDVKVGLPASVEMLQYTVHVNGMCVNGTLEVYTDINIPSSLHQIVYICDNDTQPTGLLLYNNTEDAQKSFDVHADVHLVPNSTLEVNISFSLSYFLNDEASTETTAAIIEGNTSPQHTSDLLSTEREIPAITEPSLVDDTSAVVSSTEENQRPQSTKVHLNLADATTIVTSTEWNEWPTSTVDVLLATTDETSGELLDDTDGFEEGLGVSDREDLILGVDEITTTSEEEASTEVTETVTSVGNKQTPEPSSSDKAKKYRFGETCGRLEILRGYSGLGDGTYTKIADVCETTSAYPIYEQSDIGLYLYRLTDGTWAMYDRTCSLDHYGSTTKVSPYPWTLVFDTEEVTAITCTDYRRVYDHPVTAIEGHITLPSMYVGNDDVRDATYNVSVVLPITTETLEYTVHVSGRCTNGTLQVYQVIDGDSEVVGTMPAICDSTSSFSKRIVYNKTHVTNNVFAISANIHLASSADLKVNVSYSVSYIGDDEDITTSVTEGHATPMVDDRTTVAVSTEDNDFPASTEEALLTWTNGTSGVPVYTSDKDLTTSSPEIDKDEHTVDTTPGLPDLDVTTADTRTTLDLNLLSTDSDGYTNKPAPVCEQGQYLDPAILKCFSCPAGSYQLDPLATKCAPCPAGQYQPSQGQAYCLTCPSGFYQPDEEQTACIPCPVGMYQPLTGRGECMQCPSQKTTRAEGSISQQYCNVFYCLSGFEESPVEIGQCRPCGYNTYKNNSEDPFGECTACSPGLITLEKMATSADQCVPDPCPSVRCEFGATCVRGGCQCPPSCPHIMKPVCGSDGESYTSRCDLEARVCHLRKQITVQHTGRCEDDPCSEVTCSCGQACIKGQCRCPDDDTPVCANDSKTYPSECHMLSVACATHTPLRLRYRVPCENLTRLPDIAGVITDNNPPIRGLYLVLIFVSFFVVIATTLAIIAAVLLVRRRRKRKPKEEKIPMINAATRTFSASSQNQRITVEKRPESPQQVDRLSGCITPLDEHPGFRFRNVITNNENPQLHLSSTDTSVPELNLNQSPSVVAGLDGPIRTSCLMAGPEVMPTKPRLPSVVDNGVTEKQPESTTVLDMDDVFQDDEPATKTVRFNTRL